MKLYHFVYITFRLNSPYYYIGVHSTNNMLDGYIGSGYHLRNAVKKYGKENFARCIIQYFNSHEEALKYENKIITPKILNDKFCYNIQPGGKGSKEEHLLSTREKISKTNKGKVLFKRPENYVSPLKGTTRPEYIKEKISKTCKLRDLGQYRRGILHSEETKNKMSNSQKARMTNEIKESISKKVSGKNNGFYGKHHTEEVCKYISICMKNKYKNFEERIKTSHLTKEGMQKSLKWKRYKEKLNAGEINSSMKGKKNPNLGESMKKAMHIRWHVNRNIYNKECKYCNGE